MFMWRHAGWLSVKGRGWSPPRDRVFLGWGGGNPQNGSGPGGDPWPRRQVPSAWGLAGVPKQQRWHADDWLHKPAPGRKILFYERTNSWRTTFIPKRFIHFWKKPLFFLQKLTLLTKSVSNLTITNLCKAKVPICRMFIVILWTCHACDLRNKRQIKNYISNFLTAPSSASQHMHSRVPELIFHCRKSASFWLVRLIPWQPTDLAILILSVKVLHTCGNVCNARVDGT